MIKFTYRTFIRFHLPLAAILIFSTLTQAQFRNYNIIYTDNAKGNILMYGNTLMNIVDSNMVNDTKMNSNNFNGDGFFGNDNENMQFVDIDGSFGIGSLTFNSSSSDVTIPDGSTIKFARLYWGGRVKDSDFDLNDPANRKIKIRKGNSGFYTDFIATQIDRNNFVQDFEAYSRYQAFTDITSFIQLNGTGTYTVANAPLSTGVIDNGGNYGGWCIVIVYENPALNYNSIRLYDGFQQVFDNGNPLSTSVTLTGLNVPSGSLSSSDARMGVVTWEGDANLIGDFLKINGNTFSNGINQSYNPWNGTISNNGVFVTTKNPDYTNQMGIDIDQFEVGTGYGISPNDTTASLEFGTEADQYFPGIVSFVIRMKEPNITLDKTVSDANNNLHADVGEVLTYNFTGSNVGAGNANKVVLTDTLPATVTYLPNTLEVISSPGITSGPKTDNGGDDIAEFITDGSVKYIKFNLGTGATATQGGTLSSGQTYQVRFKVTVNDPGAGVPVPAVINTARISATSDAQVIFVDDGTAILNPEAGALPVSLIYFNAVLQQDHKVHLSWSTSMEINCKGYEIQRSFDGIIFNTVGSNDGNGTCCTRHDYSMYDDIASIPGSLVYYRLAQVDVDGHKNLSKIIAVRLNALSDTVMISPNPFKSYLKLDVDWNKTEETMISVNNAAGKLVVTKKVRLEKGTNFIKIDNLAGLPAGSYFINLITTTEKISKKILKL